MRKLSRDHTFWRYTTDGLVTQFYCGTRVFNKDLHFRMNRRAPFCKRCWNRLRKLGLIPKGLEYPKEGEVDKTTG